MLDLDDLADSPLHNMAYALAGGSEPAPWWGGSHQRIIAAARALAWPSRLADLETQACRITGDEFYERLNAPKADGALLCGLALMAPPGDTESENAQLARELFPDVKGPYETALAEVGMAEKLLADHGLASSIGHPADGCRATGKPLIAHDAYGSRFLLAAPFGYGGEEPDHWYAWDIDACWLLTVAGAGVFGSAQDALAEWQHAVGPAAAEAALSPGTPEMTAGLLASCLETGPFWHMMQGTEPRELVREYYRLRRRAGVLAGPARAAAATDGGAPSSGEDPGPVREAFLGWYTARHGDAAPDMADDVDMIISEWGLTRDFWEGPRYACSPHRIEMTAHLIRDGYYPEHANSALRLLPEWTQWCIEQSGLSPEFAARSRAASLTEAAALVSEGTQGPAAERNDAPFRRQE